jgi:hypothetical protein
MIMAQSIRAILSLIRRNCDDFVHVVGYIRSDVTTDGWQAWLERVWAYREETLYREFFGNMEPHIAPLPVELFRETFGRADVDPRWLHVGVMRAAPSMHRSSWLYATSGLSNPWNGAPGDGAAVSGLGCEIVFETTESADWPIARVQQIAAFQLLLGAGAYPGRPLLAVGDRIPLRGSLTPLTSSAIQHFLVARPTGYPASFRLESGEVELLTLLGVTDSEVVYAREHGNDALLELLRRAGAFPITEPERAPVV